MCAASAGAAPICHKHSIRWPAHRQPTVASAPSQVTLCGDNVSCPQTGAALFATRIPERWVPGKVDLAGHSHQLFHIAVVVAAYLHYQAIMILLEWRDASGGCAAPVTSGPVKGVMADMAARGMQPMGIEAVWQTLSQQLHNHLVGGAAS